MKWFACSERVDKFLYGLHRGSNIIGIMSDCWPQAGTFHNIVGDTA